MSIGSHMKDRCTILRYVEAVEDGITEHRLEPIATEQRCNFTLKSHTQKDEQGYTYILTENRLILPFGLDIKAGDLIQVNGETDNIGAPVYYEAGKPYYPRNRFIRVPLKERSEQ